MIKILDILMEMYPPYKVNMVKKTRYKASDVWTNDPEIIEEIAIDLSNYDGQILPGDVLRAPKGFPLSGKKLEKSLELKVIKNSREGVNRYKLSLEDLKTGKKYSVRNFQIDGEYKGKKLPKWGLVRKSKENTKEASNPQAGTAIPYGSGFAPVKETKRIPRKSGQPAKSSKHSDLYTDEDPKGTITGLGFKDAATAKAGVSKINKANRTHAHKVQATLVMKQRAKVAMERTKDPEKKKKLRAAYNIWSKKLEQLKNKTKQLKK
jgi:hypothetical protein